MRLTGSTRNPRTSLAVLSWVQASARGCGVLAALDLASSTAAAYECGGVASAAASFVTVYMAK